jgi:Na+-transporting NADH:ubiquinone oxidoreductase subunit NqrF
VKVPDDYVREWNVRYGTFYAEVSRPYSFASSSSHLPESDLIVKLVSALRGKDVPPGLALTFVYTCLKTGDMIEISRPTGALYQTKDDGRPILIVAGSTGAAPFVCRLEYWFVNRVHSTSAIHSFQEAAASLSGTNRS